MAKIDNVGAKYLKKNKAAEKVVKSKGAPLERGSLDEDIQVKLLQDKIAEARIDFVKFNAKGKEWLELNKSKNANSTLDSRNEMFQRRMLLMTIAPLAQGINPESIMQSFGMYVGMAALTPEFRMNAQKHVGIGLGNIGEKLNNETLMKFADNQLAKSNGGRVPFTPESVACSHISMVMQAYHQMREPDADIDTILGNYEDAQGILYEMAKADGVSIEDALKSERIMVGKFIDRDPELSNIFEQTAFDDIKRSDGTLNEILRYDDDGNPYMDVEVVWQGEYEQEVLNGDGDIEYKPYEGGFTPRPPDNSDVYKNNFSDVMFQHMSELDVSSDSLHKTAQTIQMSFEYGNTNNSEYDMSELDLPDWYKGSTIHQTANNWYSKYMDMSEIDGHNHYDIQYMVGNAFSESIEKYASISDKHKFAVYEFVNDFSNSKESENSYKSRAEQAEERFSDILDANNENQRSGGMEY